MKRQRRGCKSLSLPRDELLKSCQSLDRIDVDRIIAVNSTHCHPTVRMINTHIDVAISLINIYLIFNVK